MKRMLIILLALSLSAAVGAAEETSQALSPEALYHQAGAAYRSGDYAAAEQGWRAVLGAGVEDGHCLYNLGNATYRQGWLGGAILAWRRAQVLLPRDPDVAANLDHARVEVRDRLEPASHVGPLVFWQRPLSLRESALLGAACLGLAFGLLALLRWRGRSRRRSAPGSLRGIALGLAVLGALLLLSTGLTYRTLRTQPAVVVLQPKLTVRSAVGVDGVELFALHEGAELRALEEDAGHVLVILPDGRRGWVPAAAVGMVRPGDAFPQRGPAQ